MSKLLKLLFILLIILNIYLATHFVRNNDIHFSSDIARDFFLLQELDEKKIVLIGPKSSTNLFHGPLWTYLNYPAYFLGKGNPVIVGWGWIALIIAFTISSFYISKKLFDTPSAYLFTLMISIYMSFHANGLFNPHGAMFLLPAFFFTFILFTKTLNPYFLIANSIICGLMVQFQMAVGLPFLILAFLANTHLLWKKKKLKLLSIYMLIPLTLINFIIFDLRHEFLITKLTFQYLTSHTRDHPNYLLFLKDRIWLMLSGTEILRRDPGFYNLVLTLITGTFIYFQLKSNKFKSIYYYFLYFYIGFFIMSFINSGPLLYFYLFPIFPLVFLIFSSFITSKYKVVFVIIFTMVFILNFTNALNDIKESKSFIGKNIESWNFLYNMSKKVFEGSEGEFGYFVYEPNVLAYGPKYAMLLASKNSKKTSHYFEKRDITYLVIAPPPINNPYMKDDWWKKNQLHLEASPSSVITFENGYKIEKHNLTKDQQSVPFDAAIDPGLHFR